MSARRALTSFLSDLLNYFINRERSSHQINMGKNVHVVYSKTCLSWQVKIAGKPTPASQHRTQKAAENAGRVIAKKNRSELVTHSKKGPIRSKDSFGKDPKKIIDKEH